MTRALVAMSGGVDSSVAAALMLEAGYDVVGVTLKQWEGPGGEMPVAGCCTVGDAEDARRAAAQLDVPYYVLDYVDEFRTEVVDRFGASYAAGKTPNPCIECNRRVRFKALLERTDELGCDVLVTGHHARIRTDADGSHHLLKAVDGAKDQSYVLHMLDQATLGRIRLPVGEMPKSEVRERAAALGLRTAAKPDSQDLCFVGHGNYRTFIRDHFPDVATPGPIVDMEGEVVGAHDGAVDFTIGQRKGLGVTFGEPRYVVDVDAPSATVTIGRKEDLEVGGCLVDDVSFIAGSPPADPKVEVKVRYRATPVAGSIRLSDGRWEVSFDRPQRAIAPGQSAVFYRGDEVLGGGTIATVVR
ncbi:MAG: tRNA 2-thiouridine(34) synthase MnmA [Acidimicrobiia bacterium]|nr:tRNA 2-thiouridine(34) synthase MnmA [Acidimicrobiia bacterium]